MHYFFSEWKGPPTIATSCLGRGTTCPFKMGDGGRHIARGVETAITTSGVTAGDLPHSCPYLKRRWRDDPHLPLTSTMPRFRGR